MILTLLIFIVIHFLLFPITTLLQRRYQAISVESNWFAITLRYKVSIDYIHHAQERIHRHRRLHVLWFSLGAKLALFLMIITSAILCKNIIQLFWEFNQPPSTLIVPVLPGITVPVWQIGYLWVSVAIAVSIHELGHFLCAVLYDIPVEDVGITLAFFIPMAFVNLDSDVLHSRPGWVRRAVASAGILHNIALALLTTAILLTLPVLLYPFYEKSSAPIIRHCSSSSPLHPSIIDGVTRLLSLNGIELDHSDQFIPTLQRVMSGSRGICLSEDVIDTSQNECCSSLSSEICMATTNQRQFCIKSKSQLPPVPLLCDADQPCKSEDYRSCCYLQESGHKVVYLATESSTLVFFGNPAELSTTLELTSYLGRLSFLPISVPVWTERMLNTIISVNISLALINAGPIFNFDGEHLVKTWADDPVRYRRIRGLLGLGTLLLIANVLGALISRFIQ